MTKKDRPNPAPTLELGQAGSRINKLLSYLITRDFFAHFQSYFCKKNEWNECSLEETISALVQEESQYITANSPLLSLGKPIDRSVGRLILKVFINCLHRWKIRLHEKLSCRYCWGFGENSSFKSQTQVHKSSASTLFNCVQFFTYQKSSSSTESGKIPQAWKIREFVSQATIGFATLLALFRLNKKPVFDAFQ